MYVGRVWHGVGGAGWGTGSLAGWSKVEVGSVSSVGRWGFVSKFLWGWVGLVSGVKLRLCVVGEGFQPLHWKIFSWLVVGFFKGGFLVL